MSKPAVFTALAASLLLTACGSSTAEDTTPAATGEETRSVVHALGTTEVTGTPERVVVLDSGELDAADASKAKWWCTELQKRVVDTCVQLHGGYWFMNEYRVARAWRDARVTKIWAGSNQIMKELIGRDLGF